jgi:hypothetical protein
MGEVQRRELDGKGRLVVMQHQLLRFGDTCLQGRPITADDDRAIEQLEARNRDLGHIPVLHEAVWTHRIEALRSTEVERAVARMEVRARVELASLQTVAERVHLALLLRGIEARDAPITAHPQPVRIVHRDAGDE